MNQIEKNMLDIIKTIRSKKSKIRVEEKNTDDGMPPYKPFNLGPFPGSEESKGIVGAVKDGASFVMHSITDPPIRVANAVVSGTKQAAQVVADTAESAKAQVVETAVNTAIKAVLVKDQVVQTTNQVAQKALETGGVIVQKTKQTGEQVASSVVEGSKVAGTKIAATAEVVSEKIVQAASTATIHTIYSANATKDIVVSAAGVVKEKTIEAKNSLVEHMPTGEQVSQTLSDTKDKAFAAGNVAKEAVVSNISKVVGKFKRNKIKKEENVVEEVLEEKENTDNE